MSNTLRSHASFTFLTGISASAVAAAVAVTPSAVGATTTQPTASVVTSASAAMPTPSPIASGTGWSIYEDTGSPGNAPSGMQSMATQVNCGYISCTLYVSKNNTAEIDSKIARYANTSVAAITGAFALACLPLDPIASVVCGVGGAVYGSYAIDQFNYAATHDECVAIKFYGWPVPVPTVVPAAIYPDNSQYCTK